MARLVIFDDCVRAVDLPDHAVIVGRSQKVDVPIRDPLLSRKHLTISPVSEEGSDPGGPDTNGRGSNGSCFRLMDLKSANGTFVNGARTDKYDLEYDDVIEIGNTVMVLLDTDSWSRGEGLPPLRNPLKAQELMQRLKQRAAGTEENAFSVVEFRPGTRDSFPEVTSLLRPADVESWAESNVATQETFQEALVDLAERLLLETVASHSSTLREAIVGALQQVSQGLREQADREQLRAAIRNALREKLAALEEKTPSANDEEASGDGEGEGESLDVET